MKMEKVDTKSPLAHKMSSAQLRKIKKPIIEKRRRERINDSLNQLKTLVLDAMQKDESRYNKMEKADILEMTVQHLHTVHQRQKLVPTPNEQEVAHKYTAGFTECAKEVGQYLGGIGGLTPELRLRIMSHLSQSMQKHTRIVAPQPIAPTPVCVSPAYCAPMSPPIAPVAIPCGTTIAALPGSPSHSYTALPQSVSPHTYSVLPQNGSPINLMSSTAMPVALPSNVILLSPGSSPSSSPQHSPSHVNNAIPLYVSGMLNGQSYHPTSPQNPSMDYPFTPVQKSEQHRPYSTSPVLGDDVPAHIMKDAPISEDYMSIRNTVITTINNNNNKFISSCKSQARMTYNKENIDSMHESMWRPW